MNMAGRSRSPLHSSDEEGVNVDPAAQQLIREFGERSIASADLEDFTKRSQPVAQRVITDDDNSSLHDCAHPDIPGTSPVQQDCRDDAARPDPRRLTYRNEPSAGSSEAEKLILDLVKDLDERDVACLPDAVQSSRMDVLTTEYMVKLLCEVSTQDKHTAVVRMKDAEIRQLKTKLCRLHSCIQSILEQLDESEDSGARRTEDTMLCLQSSQKTFTTNVLEAYQNQVDQYQRQVTELNEQLSRARVAEAARVQAVESQMQKPNGTRVVDRRGDEKAAAVHSNDSEGHALGLKSQDIQSGFERDAIKKGVTTSEQLKATGSLTPVCGRTGDFSKKQQVGDRKGQGTTVTVGQSPQEWGDGEKNAGFGDKPKRVTENRESRLVGEIETLRREKNAMQIENQSLNDFVAKLQYEQQLAEASEETLKRDKQQLIKRMKRMEEQISRVAVVCRHEYEQATETPLHVQHPTTDSGLSTTSGTRNSRRTATESTSKGTNQ